MTITDIYQHYNIMPQLADHMLRVGAVGFWLSHNVGHLVDVSSVVKACLLHDLGNIIKFDLSVYSSFLIGYVTEEEMPKWRQIQKEYVARYGRDEHEATMEMAQEIGVTDRVLTLLDAVSFSRVVENVHSSDIEKQICAYADFRVIPTGVVSLEERLADIKNRYQYNKKFDLEHTFVKNAQAYRDLEMVLFADGDAKPSQLTDAVVQSQLENLKLFEI